MWRESIYTVYVKSTFSENCVVTGERVDRYGRVGQVTDDNVSRRISIAYSITKVTDGAPVHRGPV